MQENEVPAAASNDVDVDALMGEIEGQENSYEIPMGDEPEAQAPAPQPEPQMFEFTVNGKPIKATVEQMQRWAQQGYDAPTKIGDLNKKIQEYETRYKPFQEIDAYARENPEWWQHVTSSWESRGQQGHEQTQSQDPVMQRIEQMLNQRLGKYDQFINGIETKEQQAAREAQDKQLDQELKSMREQYAHLDWQTVDDQGRDLETRVLAYANEHGIRKFDVAFKAFNHDRLLSLAEERGKEALAKDVQKKTKLGLLGQPAPKREAKETDVKGKSYNDLLREAYEEFGISAS